MTDIHVGQGFGRSMGLGKNPALLVVDLQLALTATDAPLGGGSISRSVDESVSLIRRASERGMSIIATATEYRADGADAGTFGLKARTPEIMVEGSKWVALDPRIAATPQMVVVRKNMPSAFFGTSMSMILTSRGIDTVIVAGCVTSGCVRATVVDAMSYGYRVIVAPECVGDRDMDAHEANLKDIARKYADVISKDELEARLWG
jgi:maleamate amidohydrolase